MNFDGIEKIAAAILYEGYILYPYRPTAIKNRQRWNFGTLYPRVYAEAQRPPEPFRLVAECLVVAEADASLDLKISFLQLVRQLQTGSEDLRELTDPSLAWEEAVERISEHRNFLLRDLIASPRKLALQMDAPNLPEGRTSDPTPGLQATLTIGGEILQDGAYKLHLELENGSMLSSGDAAKRDEALPQSFVSAHVLLGVNGGEFISLLDPAEAYRESAATCRNLGVFPVLAGEEPDRAMMLCSPIILYDYPKIAPESAGDFFDGTEMDEMLTLRVLTLTDAEKQEMRNGDPRARRILERTESLTAESMLKAHGVIRGLREIRGGAQ
jgi:hydrogenase maturation protease